MLAANKELNVHFSVGLNRMKKLDLNSTGSSIYRGEDNHPRQASTENSSTDVLTVDENENTKPAAAASSIKTFGSKHKLILYIVFIDFM